MIQRYIQRRAADAAAVTLAALAWLALAAAVRGQDAKVVTFAEGARLAVIDSGVSGECEWRLDARLRPAGYTYKDLANKKLIVARPPNGTYDILVIDYAAKKTYDFILVVDGGPSPPDPPGPPTPQTLADKIAVAFTIDKATGKGGDAQKILLGKLYGTLSQFTDNPILMSVGDAHELLHKLVEATLNGSLPTTAKVCDDYIHSKVPESADTALTAELRGRYKTTLTELATAIGGGPTPPPANDLTAKFQAAYNVDADTKKATATAALAEVLGGVVATAKASGKIVTALDFKNFVHNQTNAAIGADAIPKVRAAVGAYVSTQLTTMPTAKVDAAYWSAAASEYSKVSTALKGVVR